jgi:hypothetical protein
VTTDRRYRTRRESDRNVLSAYHHARHQAAKETAIVTGAILLAILAIAVFG